ncbi:MAG: class I SAM-dependent methyltransferase [Flavobacterium sp.]
MQIKDHSISQENFNLIYNQDLDLYQTNPIPDNLDQYYISNDYISHTDNARNWFEKMYQNVKKITLKSKYTLLINEIKNPKVLDFGCGTGDFIKYLHSKNITGVGVEPNCFAREIALSKNINVLENIKNLQNQKFDIITLWHVLEHVPDYHNQIIQLKKLLNPNGIIIIAVPNFNSYDAQYYQEYWAAYDVPRHIWHFSKKTIDDIAQNTNFTLKTIKPMWFDSFYVSLLSEKYKNKKQNLIKATFIGLLSNIKAIKSKEFSSLIYILKANE